MTERPIDPDEAGRTGAHVITRTAHGTPYAEGEVVAYCDRPTFVIKRADGSRFSWMADMTFPSEPPLPLIELPDSGAIRLNDSGRVMYFATVGPSEIVTGSTLEEALAKREEGRRFKAQMSALVEERP